VKIKRITAEKIAIYHKSHLIDSRDPFKYPQGTLFQVWEKQECGTRNADTVWHTLDLQASLSFMHLIFPTIREMKEEGLGDTQLIYKELEELPKN